MAWRWPWQRSRRNPADVLMDLASIGGVALSGYLGWQAYQKAQKSAPPRPGTAGAPAPRSPGAGAGGGSTSGAPPYQGTGSSGSGTQQPPPPATAPATQSQGTPVFATGNTFITYTAQPVRPLRLLGTPVRHQGFLGVWGEGDAGSGWLPGRNVQIWNPDLRIKIGDATVNSEGYYWFDEPLWPNELDGYRAYAFYPGSDLEGLDRATSGVWDIHPREPGEVLGND